MTRHLHRDYHTAFCGIDASYVLMTYDLGEADCADCQTAHAQHLVDLAEEHERLRQEELEREVDSKRNHDELKAQEAAKELRREEMRAALVREKAEQAKRDDEQIREWITP